MDEHQRRVWSRMIESVAAYRQGELDLKRLVVDLQGLLGAADLHDQRLIDQFWMRQAPIDGELELRTEDWAPAGSASEVALDEALDEFVAWASEVLATTGNDRT